MSGQWETVGKKKDKSNKISAKQISGQQVIKKKTENLNVKVEDVLARSQVKNLYSSDKNKENKPVDVKKNGESESKKNKKKQESSNELPNVGKTKTPKTIPSALNQIDVNDFRSVYEKSKLQFPQAPIIWLKELAQFLNQKVNVDVQDPVFATKSRSYPINVLPSGIKSVFDESLQEIDENNIQLFFDISLTSMATDMSKGLPVVGFKLFLQYIALNMPSLVTTNLPKYCALRSSYQNRPNIGLSIIWAVGQAGLNDFQAGLKIFQEVMLPIIELKNYSRYIVKYIIDLITNSKNLCLTSDDFIFLLELIYSNKKNFPSDLKNDLVATRSHLKSSLFHDNKKDTNNFVDIFLKKIATNSDFAYQQTLCDIIVECFVRDEDSLDLWTKIYVKNVTSSSVLLKYIEHNWQSISSNLKTKGFVKTLHQLEILNKDLMLKKKKDSGFPEAVQLVQILLEKMAKKKSSRSPFKFLLLTTSLVIGCLIYYDVRQQGSWERSYVNNILNDTGVYVHTQQLFNGARQILLKVDEQIEGNFPTQRRTIIEFSEPYVELLGNLGRIGHNMYTNVKEVVIAEYPAVLKSIESYAPGLMEQSQNAVSTVWSSSVIYFNRGVDYLRKEVFVGQLSPENMQRVVLEAFNTTQNKASEYYYWLYEKVQSTIK